MSVTVSVLRVMAPPQWSITVVIIHHTKTVSKNAAKQRADVNLPYAAKVTEKGLVWHRRNYALRPYALRSTTPAAGTALRIALENLRDHTYGLWVACLAAGVRGEDVRAHGPVAEAVGVDAGALRWDGGSERVVVAVSVAPVEGAGVQSCFSDGWEINAWVRRS